MPLVSPFCRHLATKKRMLGGPPPRTVAELMDASQACWCARTMRLLGPDRGFAHPDDCRLGRTCFESPFAELLAGPAQRRRPEDAS